MALTSLAVMVPSLLLAFVIAARLGDLEADALKFFAVSGLAWGMVGVMLGWLAWWGAVDPLPERPDDDLAVEEVAAVVDCGLCGQDVAPDVRTGVPTGADGSSTPDVIVPALRRIRATPRNAQPVVQRSPRSRRCAPSPLGSGRRRSRCRAGDGARRVCP